MNLPAVHWTVISSNELADITHVGDGIAVPLANPSVAPNTLKSYLAGYSDMAVTVECIWDASIQPFALTESICAGSLVHVNLFIDRSDSRARFSLYLAIESSTVEEEVRGVAKWVFTGKQSGYLGGPGSSTLQVPSFTNT